MTVAQAGRRGGEARAKKLSKERLIEIARQGYNASPIRDRYFAYKTFLEAVKRGEIKYQPCEVCGEKAQAHHDDYSKPLEVRFLCRTHHNQMTTKTRLAVSGINRAK
jgi:hypothetical protein